MPNEEFIMRTALLQGAGTLFASGQIHCGSELKKLNTEIANAAKTLGMNERHADAVVRELHRLVREVRQCG